MSSLLLSAHILAYGYTFGSTSFHSYVSSVRAFGVLPLREFGKLQGQLFPIHFLTQAIGPIVIGLTAPYTIPTLGLGLLGVSSATGLLDYLWLMPACQKIKHERLAISDTKYGGDDEAAKAKDPEYQKLSKQFGKYHGLSLLVNLVSVLGVFGYAFIIGKNLTVLKSAVPK
ncbi:unnamed protein product [Ambrosiozyma monospora]|uniref:Unnamed protein product n=1 Tax=Ambrosiozyma monospora TaxID=43982 RepID=A0ACB5SRI9_AMBMO|nr:unnamed protein product [Ambrosiozyma monospora]